MPIPDFQSVMLPLLRLTNDQKEHTLAESIEAIAQEFHLSEAERNELLPSGRQPRLNNRVGWAKTYLQKAGLLESTRRARFKITERGRQVLAENPPAITMKFLERFPEYLAFAGSNANTFATANEGSTDGGASADANKERSTEQSLSVDTPEERLEASYQALRTKLAAELLEKVKTCSPRFFEQLVVDLLVKMGYGGSRKDAGERIGRSGDEGIDGIIKEDRLGLDVVYIQAKRWQSDVGRPIVQAFAGSLEGQRARKGILITTSGFTDTAREYVRQIEKKIVLIDGEELAQHMFDFGIGVAEQVTYIVKRIDADYFDEE